jgi:hypothetical protein
VEKASATPRSLPARLENRIGEIIMAGNPLGKVSKISGPVALVLFLIGVVAISAAALWVWRSHSSSGSGQVLADDGPPLAARVDRLDGDVGIDRQSGQQQGQAQVQAQAQPNPELEKATVNAPLSVGDRIYVKDRAKAGIAFSGRNYCRLNPNTSLDVLSLAQRRTQCGLRQGSGLFDVGALASGEFFECATPNGAVDFVQPGLYQVGIDDGGNTLISVLSGAAQVVGLGGRGEISKGQVLTLAAAAAGEAYLSRLAPNLAGGVVNDYYSYRYPKVYDGRYVDYNRYQDDPYYYDPYRRSVSYQYIRDDSEVAGLDDLDDYGEWADVPNYGHCWRPRVAQGWAPYRDGYWSNNHALGLSWVSNERWGWAPYHYGRWAVVNSAWYWVPSEVVQHPVYAPALAAFVALTEADRVGWVPLGPGDPYVPHYYDENYRPQYIGSTTIVNQYVNVTKIVNYNVPGAVTCVPAGEFTRVITPGIAQSADPAWLSRARPVVDPFTIPRVREFAPNFEGARPRVDVPVEARQAWNRELVTSQNPIVPSVAANSVRAFKVRPVSEEQGKGKLRISDSGETVAVAQPNGLPVPPSRVQAAGGMTDQERQARIAALSAQAAQGDKGARQQVRQLQQEQRVQDKENRRAAAQQSGASQQAGQSQQAGGQAQQAEQRRAEKQAARQQAEQQQQQQKAERRATQQQSQQQAAQQQQQARQQRKAERQAQQQGQQQAQQQRQQQRQQQAQQQAEQQQQQKVERRAERQNAAQQQNPPQPERKKNKNEQQ